MRTDKTREESIAEESRLAMISKISMLEHDLAERKLALEQLIKKMVDEKERGFPVPLKIALILVRGLLESIEVADEIGKYYTAEGWAANKAMEVAIDQSVGKLIEKTFKKITEIIAISAFNKEELLNIESDKVKIEEISGQIEGIKDLLTLPDFLLNMAERKKAQNNEVISYLNSLSPAANEESNNVHYSEDLESYKDKDRENLIKIAEEYEREKIVITEVTRLRWATPMRLRDFQVANPTDNDIAEQIDSCKKYIDWCNKVIDLHGHRIHGSELNEIRAWRDEAKKGVFEYRNELDRRDRQCIEGASLGGVFSGAIKAANSQLKLSDQIESKPEREDKKKDNENQNPPTQGPAQEKSGSRFGRPPEIKPKREDKEKDDEDPKPLVQKLVLKPRRR